MEPTRESNEAAPASDRRCIEGVPCLRWGQNGDCTFLGALEAALSTTPHPADYRALMGATGLAFRVRWYQATEGQRWCPSSPVGEFRDEIQAAERATGWTLRAEWGEEKIACLAPDVKASIDAGLPILCYDDQMNMAVAFGYEDSGATVLLRDYSHGDEPSRLSTAGLKMFVYFVSEHAQPLSVRDAALQGMAMGVRNARRRHEPEGDEARGYWHGPLAMGKWSEDIGRAETLTEEERGLLFFVSWWNYEGLIDARSHAGPYLRSVAHLFPGLAASAMTCAAEIYEEEARLLSRPFERKDAFLGPWTGASIDQWTDDVRRREQDVLACAANLDADAIDTLERALASLEG